MVHMWVNTVTGCGLPRKEINGLRFGPLVDRSVRRRRRRRVGIRALTLSPRIVACVYRVSCVYGGI